MEIVTKIEASDIDGYDWDWLGKYEGTVIRELIATFTVSFIAEFPDAAPSLVERLAAEWARANVGERMLFLQNQTRLRVGEIVSDAISEGRGMEHIVRSIRDDHIFKDQRARTVARTETAFALGQGQKGAAISQGRDEKRWVTAGALPAGDPCLFYEAKGWIPIDEPFDGGGLDTIPAHPNCRCVVRYRTKDIGADVPVEIPEPKNQKPVKEFRCVGCKRLLGRDAGIGTRIYCRHCKAERVV